MTDKKNGTDGKEEHVMDVSKESSNLPENIGFESVFGAISMLSIRSPSHKHLFTSDLEWLVLPPVNLRQFRLFRENSKNAPIGYVSWAYVNDEVENRLIKGQFKLSPREWKSGSKPVLIDVLSPFVSPAVILQQFSDMKIDNQDFYILRPKGKADGGAEFLLLSDVIEDLKKKAGDKKGNLH